MDEPDSARLAGDAPAIAALCAEVQALEEALATELDTAPFDAASPALQADVREALKQLEAAYQLLLELR